MTDIATENLIIGAGPGGLQLGYEFQMHGIDYRIVEKADHAGAFFSTYPRHRMLLSINKVQCDSEDRDTKLRFDWNSLLNEDPELVFRDYSEEFFPDASVLVRYLNDFASQHGLLIDYETEIAQIRHGERGGYVAETVSGDRYTCDRLFVAMGRQAVKVPDFPGAELCETYDRISVDPEDYRGQRVMIVGKGNSAFETADSMTNTTAAMHLCSPTPVRMAWKTHYVGHLRAVNNSILDTYQLKSGNTILDAEILAVRRGEDGGYVVRVGYVHAENQEREIPVDRVLLCTGFQFDRSAFAESAKPAMDEKGKWPALTPTWESANQKDMYFVGALMHGLDFQKTFSGFIHGFRYNARVLAQLIAHQTRGEPWPAEQVSMTPASLTQAILDRVNVSSSLYQQPGFIGDVLGVASDGNTATWYKDVPMLEVEAHGWKGYREYWTLVLDYGHMDFDDPFNIQRFPFSKGGEDSTFLHPILKRYRDGELIAEHQVSQDLENYWYGPRFEVPLRNFLEGQLLETAEAG